jgi:pyrroline-5-carboxylate reductase
MMQSFAFQLGVIGAGKMGGALIRALIGRGEVQPDQVIAADVFPTAREALANACPGVTVVADLQEAVAQSAVLVIAIKPQDFEKSLTPAKGSFPAGQLVVSIMAGVPLRRIAAAVGEDVPVIRVMPNIVCEVAEGAFGYAANEHVTGEQKALLDEWLNLIGAAEELKEELLDAVTGLSGSGPAFAALFIEALAGGGVAAGLPRKGAQRLAAQTVLGSAKWVLECDGPAVLKDMVCSPAGTTIAGVRALEAGGVRAAAIDAVVAATQRSRELGK